MVHSRKPTAVRKRQIISAARTLIVKHGSAHVTARRIAEMVGISEGGIYRHFKSKKDILLLLADQIRRDLVGEVAGASNNGHSPLEVLDSTLRHQLSAVKRGQVVSFQIIAEIISLGDKKLNKKMPGIIDKYTACLAALLKRGVETGEVRQDINVEAAATLLFSMIQGLVNLWALSDYSFEPQLKYEPPWQTFREAVTRR